MFHINMYKIYTFQCIGFLGMFAYGYDAILKYRQYTAGPTSVIG